MSLAKAMADAANGAVLGRAIGDAHDRADEANRKLDGWIAYARDLEVQVDRMSARIRQLEKNEKATNAELEESRALLARANQNTRTAVEIGTEDAAEKFATAQRAKQYKARLSQMEKALQHTSVNLDTLRMVLEPYKAIVARLGLENEIPLNVQECAEEVWRKYTEGEKLTNDPDVQAILDVCPMPPKPPRSVVD